MTNAGPARVMSAVARVRSAVRARADAVWQRDRSQLRGWQGLRERLLRVAILVARGTLHHRLGLQAAALTYYAVFALVPVLVVLLWILALLDYLPAVSPDLPAESHTFSQNALLDATLRKILITVNHTSQATNGLVGLGVLLFAVTKMFAFTERALHIIAESDERAPRFSRMLGYVALLLLPPVVLALAGLLVAAVHLPLGRELMRVLGWVPGLELVLGACAGLGVLWLAATIFYAASARAHIAWSSAAVGGAVAAVALPGVLWVFAEFQIGVAQAGALQSGLLAGPVFLLWLFSSWYAVLMGAEIAVAHRMDRVLVRGAAAFQLDCAGERRAGVALMIRVTRAAGAAVSADSLACALRLPPRIVHDLGARLRARGLLTHGSDGLALGCDPDRTRLSVVTAALEGDPDPRSDPDLEPLALAPSPAVLHCHPDPILRQLADEAARPVSAQAQAQADAAFPLRERGPATWWGRGAASRRLR